MEIIIAIIGVLGTTLSGVLTFIFTKKKYRAEVDDTVIQNM
jgi:capsular polysaccharide biosynthesis protein